MVQINLEVKSQPGVIPKINILDILKTAEDEVEEKYGKSLLDRNNTDYNPPDIYTDYHNSGSTTKIF